MTEALKIKIGLKGQKIHRLGTKILEKNDWDEEITKRKTYLRERLSLDDNDIARVHINSGDFWLIINHLKKNEFTDEETAKVVKSRRFLQTKFSLFEEKFKEISDSLTSTRVAKKIVVDFPGVLAFEKGNFAKLLILFRKHNILFYGNSQWFLFNAETIEERINEMQTLGLNPAYNTALLFTDNKSYDLAVQRTKKKSSNDKKTQIR